MFINVLVLLLVFILMTFLGYAFHWMFHQKWSGPFWKAHMVHHLFRYPPSSFLSAKYRDAGKDNTTWLFALVFAPLIIAVIVLTVFHIISLFIGISILIEMSLIGALNNSLHDSFHLTNSFWHRFWFFDRLVKLHLNHHIRMGSNFGIFSFSWDRIFRTYWGTK
jgi:sterol desaturase/sphingolipid hydroxylase (fatty acid hydroxylase superfamily)